MKMQFEKKRWYQERRVQLRVINYFIIAINDIY